MKEVNRKYLQKAIAELEARQPPKNLWHNIEQKLDASQTEQPLKKAISELPNFDPNLSFDEIAHHLMQEEKPRKHVSLQKYWTGIAAAVALLWIGIHYFTPSITQEQQEQITYSESEEIMLQDPVISHTISALNQEDEVYQIIVKHCKMAAIQCEKPAFQELLTHYIALNTEKDTLFEAIQTKEQEAVVLPYIVRIEKEKSKVGKMLIQLLLS